MRTAMASEAALRDREAPIRLEIGTQSNKQLAVFTLVVKWDGPTLESKWYGLAPYSGRNEARLSIA